MVGEIEEDVKTFGDKRRTKIEEAEKAELETPVIDEPVTVIFSRKGWVRARQGWGVDPTTLSFKEGDDLLDAASRCARSIRSSSSIPRAVPTRSRPAQLPPARGDGAPASSLVEVQEGAHIMYVVAGKPETNVIVASIGRLRLPDQDRGHGVQPQGRPRVHEHRRGRDADRAVRVRRVAGNYVAAIAEQGRMLLFQIAEMKQMSKGRGVIIMGLEKGEKLVAVVVSDQPGLDRLGHLRAGARRK